VTTNVDLLRKTLAHVEAHPQEWNQSAWRTHLGLCFGSRACELAGGQWIHDDPHHAFAPYLVPEKGDARRDVSTLRDGPKGVYAGVRARRILGLTDDQATRLFASVNDRGRLILIVSQLCQEAA
jgi:hypothetical protein